MEEKDLERIRKLADRARKEFPAAFDMNLSALSTAQIGTPAMICGPTRQPEFWIVPYVIEDRACGFAFVTLSGEVTRLGILGANANDRASWVDASFLQWPPAAALSEVRSKFLGYAISDPVLTYDISPSKWGWMLAVTSENETRATVFITPGGWYEKRHGGEMPGLE
jgi:hypothetical protein